MADNLKQAFDYRAAQVELACLDTLCGDYEDYGLCLRIAMTGSSVAAVMQMFDANGAMTFDGRDPETTEERDARWTAEYRAESAVAA